MHVLICDDEAEVRTLFRLAFEDIGATVEEACDGNECLRMAAKNAPDLVVLDLYMPKRDGLSTLPLLRRQCPTCPVVVVSAQPAVEVFEASRSRGATACFDKISFVMRIPNVVERFCSAA